MSTRQNDEGVRLTPDAGSALSVGLGWEACLPSEAELMEPGTLRTQRLRAVSAFLRAHPTLLLPLSSHFREHQPVFESMIRGPSMAPAIPSRARLQVQVLGPQSCRPGDVVFYLADDGYMVHRVVYRARYGSAPAYLLTCGDNRLAPDPPVRSDQVLGTVIAIQGTHGWRPPGPPRPGSFSKRVLRAITLMAVGTTLWCSVAAARRLAVLLLELELVGRAAVQHWRWRHPN